MKEDCVTSEFMQNNVLDETTSWEQETNNNKNKWIDFFYENQRFETISQNSVWIGRESNSKENGSAG